ncbi:receptor like protein 43 [Raphanus sativus]|nr:receptor like protein 43 [Raphanus sativus]
MGPPGLSLSQFLLSNNDFTGDIPSFICDMPSLSTLDLSNNNFGGLIPPCLRNLNRTLFDLNLSQNRLHGGLPEHIVEGLRSLDVGHNQLTGKLPRALIHSTHLEILNVGDNVINDTFPSWLSSLPNLKVLVLRSNAFHGPILQASFPTLQIIDISHNHFSGALPSDYFVKWSAMSSSSLGTTKEKFKTKDIHTPTSHNEPKELEEEDEEVLSWIAAVVGAVPGVFLGVTLGYVAVSYRPEWFVNPFVLKQTQTQKHHSSLKRYCSYF